MRGRGAKPGLVSLVAALVTASGLVLPVATTGSSAAPAISQVVSVAPARPLGLAIDPSGDLFYADDLSGQVFEIPAGTSTPVVYVTNLASSPSSLAFDAAGNLYIGTNQAVYVSLAGSAPGTAPQLYARGGDLSSGLAVSLAVFGSTLYLATETGGTVATVPTYSGPSGFPYTPVTYAAGGFAVGGITIQSGTLYLAGYSNSSIYEVPANRTSGLPLTPTKIASLPVASARVYSLAASGTSLYAADSNNGSIDLLESGAQMAVPVSSAQWTPGPVGLAVFGGLLFATDYTARQIVSVALSSPTVPGPPSDVTTSVDANLSVVRVSWTPPVETGNNSISGYTVVASPGGTTCSTTGWTTCVFDSLRPGTYTFSVTAQNGVGSSSAASSTPTFLGLASTGSSSFLPLAGAALVLLASGALALEAQRRRLRRLQVGS